MPNAGEFFEVNARIVYWGVEGAGKTTNLNAVYSKLRPDHRGDLREVPTRLDPSVCYEILPIELGDVAGVRTQIQIVALPGTPEQAPTRKQLLDQVDGIVVVIDSQRERIDDNIASFDELRLSLGAYGRSLDDIPLVVQYNKRDLADSYALEELHRKLALTSVSVFEAVATEGTGVLQTLSTISKKVIRSLRDPSRVPQVTPQPVPKPDPELEPPAPPMERAPERDWTPERESAPAFEPPPLAPEPAQRLDFEPAQQAPQAVHVPVRPAIELEPLDAMEVEILKEGLEVDADAIEATVEQAQALLDVPWDHVAEEIDAHQPLSGALELSIVSVGEATRAGDRAVRVPLVLGDTEGQTTSLVLTIQIDPLVGEPRD